MYSCQSGAHLKEYRDCTQCRRSSSVDVMHQIDGHIGNSLKLDYLCIGFLLEQVVVGVELVGDILDYLYAL